MKDHKIIGRMVPDHKDIECRTVTRMTDIRNDMTLEEIVKQPYLGVVVTYIVECPYCHREGFVEVFINQIRSNPNEKVLCMVCNEPINIRQGQALYFAKKLSEGNQDAE